MTVSTNSYNIPEAMIAKAERVQAVIIHLVYATFQYYIIESVLVIGARETALRLRRASTQVAAKQASRLPPSTTRPTHPS